MNAFGNQINVLTTSRVFGEPVSKEGHSVMTVSTNITPEKTHVKVASFAFGVLVPPLAKKGTPVKIMIPGTKKVLV